MTSVWRQGNHNRQIVYRHADGGPERGEMVAVFMDPETARQAVDVFNFHNGAVKVGPNRWKPLDVAGPEPLNAAPVTGLGRSEAGGVTPIKVEPDDEP